ncbi:SoxR reducing system RseC family protein [Rhodocyclus tenuis]|uniref:Sigma-E factor negative regulatory protein RseC n=1 Tax=Rhodocyclus tenuis TaxID=1066 RepID=A0A840G840_RHOTE|nr:SoxR reducing system RseC family protein [Rhodocyclus tenuis]MBB4248036.1 sigma-E factor negative regulatory protein RseC [Rhodocyclus tenuis]
MSDLVTMPAQASPSARRVRSIARVLSVDGGTAWLEPEQTSACGHCASAASCGSNGLGSSGSRLEKRRFPLANSADLQAGERVVVTVDESSLLKASLTAYMIPLVVAIGAGSIAESLYGSDLLSLAAMSLGLIAGLLVARLVARRLAARGELAPHYLRRAAPGESCNAD